MEKTDLVTEEIASLADRVLNGDLEVREDGRREIVTADEPAKAAFYATWRTEIYDEEPAAVLDYTGNVPDEWEEYVTEERDDVQAMAKASFEQELREYLENYAEGDA